MTIEHLQHLSGNRANLGLPMRRRNLKNYYEDASIIMFEFESKIVRWWECKSQQTNDLARQTLGAASIRRRTKS